jgi:hypothetical protein
VRFALGAQSEFIMGDCLLTDPKQLNMILLDFNPL